MNSNHRKLYRSRHDRIIAGVCGGIAEYSSVNSNLIRLIFLLSGFILGFLNLILYFALVKIIPEEGSETKISTDNSSISNSYFSSIFSNLSNYIQQLNVYDKKAKKKIFGIKDERFKNLSQNSKFKTNFRQHKNTYHNYQALKDKNQLTEKIELDGFQNKFGISMDWRSKIMLILIILGILFLLSKFNLININLF